MKTPGSVSRWLLALKNGESEEEAARRIWERYFESLAANARRRLQGLRLRALDEEDIAIDAFDSFFRGVKANKFSQLENRDDLWQILGVVATRKLANAARKEWRLKRGGGRVRGDSVFHSSTDSRDIADASEPASLETPPELAAIADEEFERLMDDLGDEQLRRIAVWKLEGYTNAEIGEMIERKERTVERKLQLIRERWLDEV